MKKLLTIILALFSVGAAAQIDRSTLPEPAPAKEIKIGDFDQFTLKNGLRVIVVENDKLPTLSWTLSFITGPITEGDKAGYTGMVGQVLRGGTTTKTKEVLDEEIDFMGANISIGSSSISAFSLSKYKEDVLKLMTDFLYNPAFPEAELEKAITQSKTALLQGKDNPNQISAVVGSVLNYGKDHVFGELTTEETLDNITMQDIKDHYNTYFKPNIAYLVVVGDIKKNEARKLARKYFDDWKKGDVTKESFVAPTNPEESVVAIVDRPSSVQSVINITYTIDNKPGSPDNEKISLLNQILGGAGLSTRLNSNLREDKGYTYGANSNMGSSRYSATVGIGASVRNEVTDSAMVQFMYELNRLREELVTEEELDLAKNTMRGSFARSLESRGTVAQFALSAELNNLPEDYYANYLKRVDAITAEDIRATAIKYLRPDNANIVIVGKAEDIAEKLKPFGMVKFFDSEGNEVDDPTKVEVADISPKTIFDQYIQAIGGKEAVDKVKTLKESSVGTLSLGGQEISLKRVVYRMAPDKYADVQTIPMQGDLVQIYNEGEAFLKGGGQKQALPDPSLSLLKYLGVMFGERYYGEMGLETVYKGTQKINNKDAHRVEIKMGALSVFAYYDVASGLKVRMELGPAGVVDLSDYREVNGVMIPFNFTQSGGQLPAPVSYVSSEVLVNSEIDEAVFK
jgi:predicted Zn-dependent peptidase